MRLGPLQKNILLMLGATALVLAVAEIAARALWDPGRYTPMIRADPTYGWTLNPGVSVRAVDTDRRLNYQVAVNSWGWRDPERPVAKRAGTRRVLLLGDSFVFGTGVEAHERLGAVLERALGETIEIVHAAVPGWGTDQQYIYLLNDGFALEPDLVVLSLCLGTDVANNMMDHNLYGVAPKPRFEMRDNELVRIPARERPAPTWGSRVGNMLQRSRLLHYVGRHVRILRARLRPAPPPSPEAPYYSEDLETDKSQWSVYRRDYNDRFARAFEVTEALITAIHDSCLARGVPFALFAFPQKNEVDLEARRNELAHFGFAADWFDMQQPYARIGALSDRLGCTYVYPIDDFRARQADTPLFFARDAHPNPAGHALAAQSLRPVIEEKLRLPIQPTQR